MFFLALLRNILPNSKVRIKFQHLKYPFIWLFDLVWECEKWLQLMMSGIFMPLILLIVLTDSF